MNPDEPKKVRVAKIDEIPEKELYPVSAGNVPLILIRAGNQIYAYTDECPHEQLPLSQGGWVEPCQNRLGIVCPWHGACFDLATGQWLEGTPAENLTAWNVDVDESGWILVSPVEGTGRRE